jgi:hypothetical protein
MLDPQQLSSPEFWQRFAPNFHISDLSYLQATTAFNVPDKQRQALRAQMIHEGYFQGTVQWASDPTAMANLVRQLSAAGLSPVFAFLYDEFWMPFFQLHFIYSGLLGDKYFYLPDFWVWNVDPKKAESGWRPHRDKGRMALLPDGAPKSLTTWIPLSTATPLNGCMYIVPANFDPTYGSEQEKEWKFEYPSIRALPAKPGDFFMWNQAVLHWGSKTSPRGNETRVSMAFEFQRADVAPFNQPLLQPLSNLPFASRLKLIAKQVLQYRHMYKVDPAIERLAGQLVA